jgi:hypothetical protein
MDLKTATSEALAARQKLLENEIEANEEENRQFQAELDQIYAEQDQRRTRLDPLKNTQPDAMAEHVVRVIKQTCDPK